MHSSNQIHSWWYWLAGRQSRPQIRSKVQIDVMLELLKTCSSPPFPFLPLVTLWFSCEGLARARAACYPLKSVLLFAVITTVALVVWGWLDQAVVVRHVQLWRHLFLCYRLGNIFSISRKVLQHICACIGMRLMTLSYADPLC